MRSFVEFKSGILLIVHRYPLPLPLPLPLSLSHSMQIVDTLNARIQIYEIMR